PGQGDSQSTSSRALRLAAEYRSHRDWLETRRGNRLIRRPYLPCALRLDNRSYRHTQIWQNPFYSWAAGETKSSCCFGDGSSGARQPVLQRKILGASFQKPELCIH